MGRLFLSSRPRTCQYSIDSIIFFLLAHVSMNRNAIRESDWTPAVVTATHTANDIINSIPPGGRTALQYNAGVLSQQAAKYAAICPVVVLFDWKSMVLLDLRPNNQQNWDDRTNPVQYMFTNGQTSAGGTIWTHRKFLLAAFLHGMRKRGLIQVSD